MNILTIIPSFKGVCKENERLCAEVLFLRGELRDAMSRFDEAHRESTHNLKLLSNWQAIQSGAIRVPFPDVHIEMHKPQDEIPLVAPGGMSGMGPRLARDIQRARVQESRRKAAEDHSMYVARQQASQLGDDPLGLNAL